MGLLGIACGIFVNRFKGFGKNGSADERAGRNQSNTTQSAQQLAAGIEQAIETNRQAGEVLKEMEDLLNRVRERNSNDTDNKLSE